MRQRTLLPGAHDVERLGASRPQPSASRPPPAEKVAPLGARVDRHRCSLPRERAVSKSRRPCTRCHGLNMITNSWGYTKEGWQDRIATMVKLPSDQLDTVTSYLTAHYPIKDAPSAVLILARRPSRSRSGSRPRWVRGRTTRTPAPTDRSGGPVSSPASSGRTRSARAGQIREFDLPANTQPHGLAQDAQGNIWYTGIQKGVIGMLDPRTGRVDDTRSKSRAHAARIRRFWISAAAICSSRSSRDTSAGSTPAPATW